MVRGKKNPLHQGFAKRLKRARRAAGLTPVALARLAGLSSPTSAYTLENGDNIPRVDTVETLAYALKVAPCFLAFGIKDEAARRPGTADLPARLLEMRSLRELSRLRLAQLAEVSEGLVRKTESGQSIPTLGTVEKLAKALGVSPAWLGYGVGPKQTTARRGPQPTSHSEAAG